MIFLIPKKVTMLEWCQIHKYQKKNRETLSCVKKRFYYTHFYDTLKNLIKKTVKVAITNYAVAAMSSEFTVATNGISSLFHPFSWIISKHKK